TISGREYALKSEGDALTFLNDERSEVSSVDGTGLFTSGTTANIENKGTISGREYALKSEGDALTFLNDEGSEISSADGTGFLTSGATANIENKGTISGREYALKSEGADLIFNNLKDSEVSSFDGTGLLTSGDKARIENIGTISGREYGIISREADFHFKNSADGVLSSSHGSALFQKKSGAAYVVNYGRIEGKESALVTENQKTLIFRNFGLLESDGRTFVSRGGSPVLLNKGKISTSSKISGDYAVGGKEGGVFHLINSGIIRGSVENNIPAIKLSGGGTDTLEFKKEFSISGDIVLDNATKIILGKEVDSSFRLDFGGSGVLNFNERDLNSLSVPVFYSASERRLASFNPTALVLEGDILASVSSDVSSLIAAHSSVLSYNTGRKNFWTSSFVSSMKLGGERNIPFSNQGFAVGYETILFPSLSLGILAGYNEGRYTSTSSFRRRELPGYKNDLSGLFFAFHMAHEKSSTSGLFVKASFSGGTLSHADKRFMNYHKMKEGMSYVMSTYKSLWIAPEVTSGAHFDMGSFVLTPSMRIRFAYQSVDGYTEKGKGKSSAVVTFSRRSSKASEGRLQMALTRKIMNMSSVVSAYSGVQYGSIGTNGAGVNLSMFDMSRNFKIPDQKDRFSIYTGALLNLNLGRNVSLNAGLEFVFGDVEVKELQYRANFGLSMFFKER
ncbi:MAG: autotransporter outer membrane beta-barrel domain-containing protein, partial [Alphaproteobacteria bacterium]|nr:autotransporter outer membrane beta-barrel domain-containing protein [Alphaproteobacteria bacterium]